MTTHLTTDMSSTGIPMSVSFGVQVPMADGGYLSGNVYRPVDSGPVPVIVTMGPYGKDVPLSQSYPQLWPQLTSSHPDVLSSSSGRFLVWEVPDPERWVPEGYAVVHLDARGTGGSPGMWSPMSPEEAEDFAGAIEWLAGRSWSTGKVGVLGVSYHAMAAWRVAERQPPHLAGVIPWYGAGDAFREAWRHGGILSNAFIDAWWYRWVRNQYGSGSGPISQLTGEPTTGGESLDPQELRHNRADIPALTREHRLYDTWASSQAVDWSSVTVPFLSVASLTSVGLHLRGNVEAFRRAASAEKWLMVLATQGSGIERFYGDDGFDIQRRFFDHYLKGLDNDWLATPRVTYEMGHGAGIESRTAAAWPPESASELTLLVDLDERVMTSGAPRSSASVDFWPSSDGVTVRSSSFDRPTEVVGPIAVRLQVSTTADDVDFFVYLAALDPAGAVVGSVAQGWLRLSQRELDPDASGPDNPVHSQRRRNEVISGHRYAADIELWPASALVPAGGSLLLTIRGTDADTIGQFRHDDPDDRPSSTFAGWTTLHTDEQADSWVLLHTADHE